MSDEPARGRVGVAGQRCGRFERSDDGTGKRLADFKLLFPTDYADYLGSRDKFTKDWNGMLGL